MSISIEDIQAAAARLAGKLRLEGRTAAIVLSGGNIDAGLHARIMAGEL